MSMFDYIFVYIQIQKEYKRWLLCRCLTIFVYIQIQEYKRWLLCRCLTIYLYIYRYRRSINAGCAVPLGCQNLFVLNTVALNRTLLQHLISHLALETYVINLYNVYEGEVRSF